MDVEAAKMIGAGLAVIALAGVGVGIGSIFSSLVSSIARNPAARDTVFGIGILGFALTEEGDWNQDLVFAKFDVIIEPQNQRAYAAAYAKMMSAAAEDVGLRSWGNDLVGFGNDMFTNWVYLGAENLTQLDQIQQALFAHPAYATFAKETASMRVTVNTTQLQFLKAYPRQD